MDLAEKIAEYFKRNVRFDISQDGQEVRLVKLWSVDGIRKIIADHQAEEKRKVKP